MSKLMDFIDNFEENLIVVLLPVMVLIIFTATFFRYSGLMVLPWAEEVARYMMIWIIYLGIGTGAKKNSHFAVEILYKIMPQFTHKFFVYFRTLVVVGFCGYIINLSYNLIQAQIMMGQTSPAMQIPIWVAYLAIPVGCSAMAIRSIQHLVISHREQKTLNQS
ncbi:MAG: TRAP transporter small permease [Bacillota bacterium]|nr:TRAP transporter small permease [Bacillota bacterium]